MDAGVVHRWELGGFDPRWQDVAIPEADWHFHRQLLDRYGTVLGPGEYSRMLRHIRRGKALEVRRCARNRSIYAVWLRCGELIYVIASKWMAFTAYPPSKAIRAERERLVAASRNAKLFDG